MEKLPIQYYLVPCNKPLQNVMALNNHASVYDFADQYFGPGESAGLVQALLCICSHLGGSPSEYWLTTAALAGEQQGWGSL